MRCWVTPANDVLRYFIVSKNTVFLAYSEYQLFQCFRVFIASLDILVIWPILRMCAERC